MFSGMVAWRWTTRIRVFIRRETLLGHVTCVQLNDSDNIFRVSRAPNTADAYHTSYPFILAEILQ